MAIESFAGEVAELGYPVTIQRGQRLRGSNPVVEQFSYYFVQDGADDQEKHRARVALTPTASEPSESVERRKKNAVAQLRQALLDCAELQRQLDKADE